MQMPYPHKHLVCSYTCCCNRGAKRINVCDYFDCEPLWTPVDALLGALTVCTLVNIEAEGVCLWTGRRASFFLIPIIAVVTRMLPVYTCSHVMYTSSNILLLLTPQTNTQLTKEIFKIPSQAFLPVIAILEY